MPRKFILEDGEEIEQEFTVVIDAREQLRKINSGSLGNASCLVHRLALLFCSGSGD
jgi:hypothetical protein